MAGDVNNFGAVRLRLKDASRRLTDDLSDVVAEGTRVNAEDHLDTGFYRLNIYAMHGGDPSVPSHNALMTDKHGKLVMRTAAQVPGVRVDMSSVVAAADYSIYLEMEHGDMFRAVENARSKMPDLVNRVRKDFNLGE